MLVEPIKKDKALHLGVNVVDVKQETPDRSLSSS